MYYITALISCRSQRTFSHPKQYFSNQGLVKPTQRLAADYLMAFLFSQVKFTSAVKLSEGGPGSGMENGREDEENFFKRLGNCQ